MPGTKFSVKTIIAKDDVIAKRQAKPHNDLRDGELYIVLEEIA
jgi:hypothetical protein